MSSQMLLFEAVNKVESNACCELRAVYFDCNTFL